MSQWTPALTVVFLAAIEQVICDCCVLVHEPWPMPYIIVPRESTVEMSCTARERTYIPFWLINLANDTKNIPLLFLTMAQSEQLNAHGVYQIETAGMERTVRLLINDTARNNQTVIQCDQSASAPESTTTLFVLDPTILLTGQIVDMGVNLSWSQESPSLPYVALKFTLSVSSGSTSDNISLGNESYYYFTAPKGAPPCEVYNFSVTATYVGATYTEAGCSVHSSILSTMLPSLPDISRLESSLGYVLRQQTTGFALYVYFEPASYCENYPMTNYTLVVNGSQNDEIMVSVLTSSAETFTLNSSLLENAIYCFIVQVANTVGVVSTSDRKFYTTDVQGVTATLMAGVNTSTIQCEFITGSNAAGCMVLLTSENGQEEHYHLTKIPSMNCSTLTVTLKHPLSSYNGVVAFDIESDGSIGSLAISGQLRNVAQAPCIQAKTLPDPVLAPWIIALVAIVMAITVCIVIIVACNSKRVRNSLVFHNAESRCLCTCLCLNENNDNVHAHMYEEIFLNQLNNTSIGDTDTVPKVYGVSTEIDGIETTPNEVYGVGTDSIETTPNEVYEVGRADGIETIPNEVYGISTDGIVTTPNVVYDKM